MLLFQKYSNFSSSVCRYIFKQDLMRRCHLNRNCLILPCVDTKGAEIFRLQPTTAAYASPCLELFGEDGASSSLFPSHRWGAWNQPHSSRPLCFSLFTLCCHTESVQHFAQCLPCGPVLLLGVGLEHPELPSALPRLSGSKGWSPLSWGVIVTKMGCLGTCWV